MVEDTQETVLAICYDFDRTLTPDDMQAQGYIQSVGADVTAFWDASNGMAKENEMGQNLAYMLEIKNEAERSVLFTRQKLEEYGGKIRLFLGVKDWFVRTRLYGEMYGVKVSEGALYLGSTRHRITVSIDEKLRIDTRETCRKIHQLLSDGLTPQAEFGPHCSKCSLMDECKPTLSRLSAKQWIHNQLMDAEIEK